MPVFQKIGILNRLSYARSSCFFTQTLLKSFTEPHVTSTESFDGVITYHELDFLRKNINLEPIKPKLVWEDLING